MNLSYNQFAIIYCLSMNRSTSIKSSSCSELKEFINYLSDHCPSASTVSTVESSLIELMMESDHSKGHIPLFVFRIMFELEKQVLVYYLFKQLMKRNEYHSTLSYKQALHIVKCDLFPIRSLYTIHQLYTRKFIRFRLKQYILSIKLSIGQ